jgi:hypothetical protein
MKRLNGWQRLWAVAMVLWALPVLFVTYLDWPIARNISDKDVLKRMNPADARQLADAATAPRLFEADRSRLDKIVHQMETNGESSTNIQTVVDDFKQMHAKPEVVIVDDDGTEHVFPPGFDPKRGAAIVRGQVSGLHMVLRLRRAALAGQALASWAIVAAVVYALGWAVAWIRRGFAGSH